MSTQITNITDRRSITSRISIHDLAKMREAILSVIDDGDPKREDGHGRFCNRWQLDDPNEDIANAQRLAFCDAVQTYMTKREAVTGDKAARASALDVCYNADVDAANTR